MNYNEYAGYLIHDPQRDHDPQAENFQIKWKRTQSPEEHEVEM